MRNVRYGSMVVDVRCPSTRLAQHSADKARDMPGSLRHELSDSSSVGGDVILASKWEFNQ